MQGRGGLRREASEESNLDNTWISGFQPPDREILGLSLKPQSVPAATDATLLTSTDQP